MYWSFCREKFDFILFFQLDFIMVWWKLQVVINSQESHQMIPKKIFQWNGPELKIELNAKINSSLIREEKIHFKNFQILMKLKKPVHSNKMVQGRLKKLRKSRQTRKDVSSHEMSQNRHWKFSKAWLNLNVLFHFQEYDINSKDLQSGLVKVEQILINNMA